MPVADAAATDQSDAKYILIALRHESSVCRFDRSARTRYRYSGYSIAAIGAARRGENKTATVAARFDSGRDRYAFAEQKRFALPLGHSMEWLEQVIVHRIPPRITPYHMLAIVSVHDAFL